MKVRLRGCAGLWLGLGLLCGAQRSFAESVPNLHVALEYRADPAVRACPTSDELISKVTTQLGYNPFTDGAEQHLRVEIAKVGEHTEATIQWIDAQAKALGERQLHSESADCTEIARSVAFAVVVQIQLHASEAEAQPASEAAVDAPVPTKPVEVPKPSPPAPPAAPSPEPSSQRRQRRVLLGAGGLLSSGLTPGLVFGGRVFGAIASDSWAIELGARATLPSERRLDDGTGFSARELSVSLSPCLRLQPVGICAVGALGLLHVRGEGVDRVGTPTSSFGGVGARLQLLWPELQRFGVLAQVEALAVVTPRDVYLNEVRVWSTAPVLLTASLDFAAIFR